MILLLSLLLQIPSVPAAPVFNRSVPAGEGVVLYPDQFDPNLFYFTVQNLGVPKSPGSLPEFRINIRPSYFGPFRVGSQPGLEVDLRPNYDSIKLETAFNLIISNNSLARFKKLTADRSRVILSPKSDRFFTSIDCCVEIAPVGDLRKGDDGFFSGTEVQTTCTYWLTNEGEVSFLPSLMSGASFLVSIQESYEGVIQTADGSFTTFTKTSIISSALSLAK